ncbi:LppU/SCO3897 family protein [Streptomyces asoensis]|uniref:LppU/SCO3897 family protein n=1 Tax=Streptomyces asoensis TaxID=249586 RepID=UPI0033E8E4BF
MSTPPPPQGQNPYAQQGQNPYAQPQGQAPYPPQGGHPQQPGQPGQPGYPAAPYGAVPPEQPRRKVSFKLIKNIVIIVAVIGVAIAAFISSRDDANTAAVGDCMHRGSSNDNDPDLEVVKCDSSQAQYIVLAKVKGTYTQLTADSKCEAEAKDFQYSYTESGDGSNFLLCLKDYTKK